MKTAFTILSVALFATTVLAQNKPESKPASEADKAVAETKTTGKPEEAQAAKNELDPNVRAQINQVRSKVYGLGGARKGPGC